MNAKRVYERPTEVQVFARLANFGPEPVNADVELSIDGRVRSVASTALPPERWTDDERKKADLRDSVEFTIELTTAATLKVESKMLVISPRAVTVRTVDQLARSSEGFR